MRTIYYVLLVFVALVDRSLVSCYDVPLCFEVSCMCRMLNGVDYYEYNTQRRE